VHAANIYRTRKVPSKLTWKLNYSHCSHCSSISFFTSFYCNTVVFFITYAGLHTLWKPLLGDIKLVNGGLQSILKINVIVKTLTINRFIIRHCHRPRVCVCVCYADRLTGMSRGCGFLLAFICCVQCWQSSPSYSVVTIRRSVSFLCSVSFQCCRFTYF